METNPASKIPQRRVCLLEFWGLGDATMMTSVLQSLIKTGWKITVVCKPASAMLLKPSYPDINYITFDAPWTVFAGKYYLWRWPWLALARLFLTLRQAHFDVAVSFRKDPRDHLLMWLIGARRRLGFPRLHSQVFLTDAIRGSKPVQHTVEDWWDIQKRLLPDASRERPRLSRANYATSRVESCLRELRKPIIGLHCGARIHVRRWPAEYFRELIHSLRLAYDFDLVLIPDLDGYGAELENEAQAVLEDMTLPEMVDALGRCDLLLCNDSAPGHIADALGVPVIAIFGPTHPVWFRPFGPDNLVVIRDICPYRPCFDNCKMPETICLLRLTPDSVEAEIIKHIDSLVDRGLIPEQIRKRHDVSR